MSKRVYVPGYGYVGGASSPKGDVRGVQGPATGGSTRKPFNPPPPTTTASSGPGGRRPSSMSSAYGVDAGDPIVSMPNLNWYYSSADVYGSQNPADPRSSLTLSAAKDGQQETTTPMWNFGLSPTDGERAYEDDALVPPGLRDALDTIAQRIHPMKKGKSLWEEAVAASALASQRGDYITPYAVLRSRYFSDESPGTPDGSGPSGGRRYGGGGGGGGGGTQSRIDLSSPSEAQGLLTQFMQSAVGRNPKPNEVEKFLELLQGYQQNNPVTASVSGSTVTQSGGVDAGMVAQEFVQGLPDYDESQADRYYRTFMSALLGGA